MADKTLNMMKYGWVRNKEGDFSDDGNRFISYYFDPYKTGDTRIETSKLVSNGEVYISAHYRNSKNGRYTYFDELNGVSYETALQQLPELAKRMKDFLDKLDADGGDKFVTLTAEQYNDIIDKCAKFSIEQGKVPYANYYLQSYIKDQYGFEFEDIGTEQRNQLVNDIKDKVRNGSTNNPVVLKLLAKKLLDETLSKMKGQKGSYNHRGQYTAGTPALELEKALESTKDSVYISSYSYDPESAQLIAAGVAPSSLIYFKNQTDRAQQKIIEWVKNKLESLYDFEWSEED